MGQLEYCISMIYETFWDEPPLGIAVLGEESSCVGKIHHLLQTPATSPGTSQQTPKRWAGRLQYVMYLVVLRPPQSQRWRPIGYPTRTV